LDSGVATEDAKPKKRTTSALDEQRAGYATRTIRKKAEGREGKRREAIGIMTKINGFKQRLSALSELDPDEETEAKDKRKDKEEGTFSAIWDEGDEEGDEDWLSGAGLKFHTSADKAFKLEAMKAREQLEIFDPLAARGNNEILANARKKRSQIQEPQKRRKDPHSKNLPTMNETKW